MLALSGCLGTLVWLICLPSWNGLDCLFDPRGGLLRALGCLFGPRGACATQVGQKSRFLEVWFPDLGAKMGPKIGKNRRKRTSRFQTRFLNRFLMILTRFWSSKIHVFQKKMTLKRNWSTCISYRFLPYELRFRVFKMTQKTTPKTSKKKTKNCEGTKLGNKCFLLEKTFQNEVKNGRKKEPKKIRKKVKKGRVSIVNYQNRLLRATY